MEKRLDSSRNAMKASEELQRAFASTPQMELAKAAALNAMPNLEHVKAAALNSTPHMEWARAAALNHMPYLEQLQAILKPTPQMEILQATLQKQSHHYEALRASLTSVPNLDALQAMRINLSPQFEAAKALLKPVPGLEVLMAKLKPLVLDTSKLLPALSALNLTKLDADLLKAAEPSKALLDAVSYAGHLFQDDSDRHRQLSRLITQYLPADGPQRGDISDTSRVGQELSAAAEAGDLSRLSPKALLSFLMLLACLVSLVANFGGARQELCFWQPTLLPEMTSGQKGKAIRRLACDAPSDVLKNMRFVRGTGVQLRESPSMKGRVLSVSLSDGDLLDIISSENRDWLLVSVVGQDGVEGWISRRYAIQIKR
ncbi:SH3 domain-containing protein [Pseudomonas oryzihabitans]|uniref:SH3 domain-containing protein n=1 Tax=Pseudomonas oryzihabitans TaxID=47885 RepID=UPI00135E9424|nr:SH3 domain-containing protein [Pseudomonas oryzihabitans]MXS20914.1 hypothetical protein [Pseudomonas oryzihabitans]